MKSTTNKTETNRKHWRNQIKGKSFAVTVYFYYSETDLRHYSVIDSVHDCFDNAKEREATIHAARWNKTDLTTGAFFESTERPAHVFEVDVRMIDKNL